jgi:hypothetical protein
MLTVKLECTSGSQQEEVNVIGFWDINWLSSNGICRRLFLGIWMF